MIAFLGASGGGVGGGEEVWGMSARVLAFRARLVAVDAIRLGGVFHVGEQTGPGQIASGNAQFAGRPAPRS